MRDKHNLKIFNNSKEALLLYKLNNNTKQFNATQEEIRELEKLRVQKFHHSNK